MELLYACSLPYEHSAVLFTQTIKAKHPESADRPKWSALFTYLDMLKQPFFKIDSDYYMIKGIQGNDYFRIAVHGKHEDQLEELERTITDCMEK